MTVRESPAPIPAACSRLVDPGSAQSLARGLPLGRHRARVIDTPAALEALLATALQASVTVRASRSSFLAAVAEFDLGLVRIVAVCARPHSVSVGPGPDRSPSICLPLDAPTRWRARGHGLQMPASPFAVFSSGFGHVATFERPARWVLVRPSLRALQQAELQARRPGFKPDLRLAEDRVIPLSARDGTAAAVLRGVLQTLADATPEQDFTDFGLDQVVIQAVSRLLLAPKLHRGVTASNDAAPEQADEMDDLLRWMQDNLGEPMTFERLSAHAGLPPHTILGRFKARFGVTPLQWIREQRLLLARERLQQAAQQLADADIERIAHEGGFSSRTAFTLAYRLRFGETPTQTAHMSRYALRAEASSLNGGISLKPASL